ncbi:MAG: PhzF family phenazine biosynthesis protein [Pseudomonadota bacterium]
MPLNYQILDVFVSTPFAGNPLAVVDLRDETVLRDGLPGDDFFYRVAQEFNFSDTVFLCPPENDVHSSRLRILTPDRELPFAGHPTVGAAVALARSSLAAGLSEGLILLEVEIGLIRAAVKFEADDEDRINGFGEFDLLSIPEKGGWNPDKNELAFALGVSWDKIGFENHEPTLFDGALPYFLVPVADQSTLASLKPNPETLDALLKAGREVRGPEFDAVQDSVYVYSRDTVTAEADFAARKLWVEDGRLQEDPATGSAVASLAGALHLFDAPLAGLHKLCIEQGHAIGRPSKIRLEMDVGEDGALVRTRLGGEALLIGEGSLFWP